MIDPLINSDIKKNTDPKPVIYDFEGESDILVLKFLSVFILFFSSRTTPPDDKFKFFVFL